MDKKKLIEWISELENHSTDYLWDLMREMDYRELKRLEFQLRRLGYLMQDAIENLEERMDVGD